MARTFDMTLPIYDLARAAGKTGDGFSDWINTDEAQGHLDGPVRIDHRALEAAFYEGRRSTWTVAWTTAPEAYDGFGTTTLEMGGEWHGKTLRKISIDPEFYGWQTGRFGSGMHGTWAEDPRLEEARVQEQIVQDKLRREQEAAQREVGLVWLTTVDASKLESTDANWEEWHAHGVRSEDVRAERDYRTAVETANTKRETWARCAAIIPEGASIVDPGAPSKVGRYGRIPGRDPYAWRSVKIVPGYPADDPEKASVVGEGNETVASLTTVAEWITEGHWRLATPEDIIPPVAVLQRIGHRDLRRIHRVDTNGVISWVGRASFGERMVLDENGHLVRSKKIREHALSVAPNVW